MLLSSTSIYGGLVSRRWTAEPSVVVNIIIPSQSSPRYENPIDFTIRCYDDGEYAIANYEYEKLHEKPKL